jgi:hypothetical protein
MSPEQFTFWLQGFFELTDSNKLSANQVKMIKEHLGLVFSKVTPPLEQKPKQSELDKILEKASKEFNEIKRWPRSHTHPGKIC